MQDIGFLPIYDMPIFFDSFWPTADAGTDIFPIVWKQVSPVQSRALHGSVGRYGHVAIW